MSSTWAATSGRTRDRNGRAIEVRDLHKSFGDNEVLKGADLDAPSGKVVCIIGPSGSGKSTLLRCLNGLETRTSGEVLCLIGPSGSGKSTLLRCVNGLERIEGGRVLFDGRPVVSGSRQVREVRRRMGMVFQNFELFPHLTALGNVTIGPRTVLRLPRAEAESRAMVLLAKVGLADHARKPPAQLSGGQQQRVAIVRALAMRPELMLLDEVTSALDPELVAEVLQVIRELAESGMTMLIATHEMSFARDIADRVCFLDDGVILEQGPPERIFSAPEQPRTQQFLERIVAAGRI